MPTIKLGQNRPLCAKPSPNAPRIGAWNSKRTTGATSEPFPISRADKIACLTREIAMREHVYPRWIEKGNMTQEKADHELAVMKDILNDYTKEK